MKLTDTFEKMVKVSSQIIRNINNKFYVLYSGRGWFHFFFGGGVMGGDEGKGVG